MLRILIELAKIYIYLCQFKKKKHFKWTLPGFLFSPPKTYKFILNGVSKKSYIIGNLLPNDKKKKKKKKGKKGNEMK